MVQNGPNGRKWSKWSKMVKNGGPDLKRARRTGLSARRAQRTKSRGPKGLQLEVGARRAPRLLVFNICKEYFFKVYFPKVYLLKVYFLKMYFPKMYFLKVYSESRIFQECVPGPNFFLTAGTSECS